MNKLRELFSDTLIYGISSVVARFINYLLVPFHTEVFNPARYSIVGLVYAAIAFLNVIFTLGMESAYLRYARDRDQAPHIFKTLQIGLLLFASALAALFWLLEPLALPRLNLDEQTSGIYLMMLGILWFDTLAIVPLAELRLIRRSVLFAVLKTGHVVVNLFLNFYLILVLDAGIEAVFISNLVASVLMTLLLWVFTLPMLRGSWDSSWLTKAFSFGWPFVPAGLGYVINEMLDRFFLNAMDPDRVFALYGQEFTPDDIVGIYSACYKLSVFMLLLIQMFRMAWQPFFMRHADDPEAPRTFARAFSYFNLAAAAVFLLIGLYTPEIAGLPIPLTEATLINSRYWLGLDIVPILLLAYWFHGWYINFSAGIFISERTSILPVITLTGAGITILFNTVLVPLLGMNGSALATLLSYSLMALMLFRYSVRAFTVPYRIRRGLLVMGFSVAVVATAHLAGGVGVTGEQIFRLMLLVGSYAALGFVLFRMVRRDRSAEQSG